MLAGETLTARPRPLLAPKPSNISSLFLESAPFLFQFLRELRWLTLPGPEPRDRCSAGPLTVIINPFPGHRLAPDLLSLSSEHRASFPQSLGPRGHNDSGAPGVAAPGPTPNTADWADFTPSYRFFVRRQELCGKMEARSHIGQQQQQFSLLESLPKLRRSGDRQFLSLARHFL